jgi:hypothetical protein
VDIRSKELDNTAVPLPFEIYATLKTVKYSEVERAVHQTIDSLTDLRIRQNREFFNITPSEALNILKRMATMLDDAEIEEYENNLPIDFDTNKVKSSAKVGKSVMSDTSQLQLEFWNEFAHNAAFQGEFSKLFSLRKPYPQHWYDLSVGIAACHITLTVSRQKRELTSGIYVSDNIEFFNHLVNQKDLIEKELGYNLELSGGKKDKRIYMSKPFNIDDKDNGNWQMAFEWLYNTSIKLREIVNKYGK